VEEGICVCLRCLPECLKSNYLENLQTDFNLPSYDGRPWVEEELVKFWSLSISLGEVMTRVNWRSFLALLEFALELLLIKNQVV